MTTPRPSRAGFRTRLPFPAGPAIAGVLLAFTAAPAAPASADAPEPPAAVEPFDTPPSPVQPVEPEYPQGARKAGIEGDVLCAVTIDAEGRVTSVEVLRSAAPLLDDAARRALLQWVFSPALRDGEPVPSQVVVPVRFALDSTR